jgi:hypothetical protein
MTSGRSLKKSSLVLVFLVFRGSCVVLHVSSSVQVRVFFVSESRDDSHNTSMLHTSSILLSVHSCPMVSSSSREGSREEVPSFWSCLIYADLEGFSRRVVNCCDGQHFSYSS